MTLSPVVPLRLHMTIRPTKRMTAPTAMMRAMAGPSVSASGPGEGFGSGGGGGVVGPCATTKVGMASSLSFRDKSILVLGGLGRLSAELG